MLAATFLMMNGAHYANGFCARGKGVQQQNSDKYEPLTMKEKMKLVPVSSNNYFNLVDKIYLFFEHNHSLLS